MKKLLIFIKKNYIYLIITLIAVLLIIVSFTLLDINFIEWIKSKSIYIVLIISFCILFLTFYYSQKIKNK